MQRLKYGIKNGRIWHLCSAEIESNGSVTFDNWTRYRVEYRDTFYLNDKEIFLEVNYFSKTFKFFKSGLRKQNEEDFRKYYQLYLEFSEEN